MAFRPNRRPKGHRRFVEISDNVSLRELLHLGEEHGRGPRVEMYCGKGFLKPSPESEGKHEIKITFFADSNATRKLTDVYVEDTSIDINPKEKPSLKRGGFQIKVFPIFNIRELDPNESV